MQKWEYLLLVRRRKGHDVGAEWEDSTQPAGHSTNLDQLGTHGWELVSVVPQAYKMGGEYSAYQPAIGSAKDMPIGGWFAPVLVTYYFKRPIT